MEGEARLAVEPCLRRDVGEGAANAIELVRAEHQAAAVRVMREVVDPVVHALDRPAEILRGRLCPVQREVYAPPGRVSRWP